MLRPAWFLLVSAGDAVRRSVSFCVALAWHPGGRGAVVHMSQRMSGEAVCDVASCRYRSAVEVHGGDAEFRQETSRVLDAHRRYAHPWLFAAFAAIEGLPLWTCSVCGAAVGDAEAHGRWHQTSQV